jgi:hypothetical protein
MNGSPPLPLLLRCLQPLEFPRKLGLCERLFANRLARLGDCWVRTSTGVVWRLDLRNPTHRWMVYGDYEGSGFLNWVRSNVPPTGAIVDSGANIGQMAVYFGVVVRGGGFMPSNRVRRSSPGSQSLSRGTRTCRSRPFKLG